MTILGIESASLVASAAILKDNVIIAEFTTDFRKTHSETLLPMVESVMKMCSFTGDDIDLIAVSEGPGSFTGLRIGAAIAKGLAYAWNKPIVPVPTLDAMAEGYKDTGRLICPVLDARRNQVYTGLYGNENGVLTVYKSAAAMDIKEAVMLFEEFGKKSGKRVAFMGDGLFAYEEKIREIYSENYGCEPVFAADTVRYQRAGSVCLRAKKLYSEGKTVTSFEYSPLYLRMSQAEQDKMKKDPE